MTPLSVLGVSPFWEILGVLLIVAVPTVPATYFLWGAIVSARSERSREVASGRASGTPFGLLSIVGTIVLVAAVLVTVLVVVARASLA